MATSTADSRDAEDVQSKTLIRRFTGELAGTTTLEIETKAAQDRQDQEDEEAERSRIRRLQDSFNQTESYGFIRRLYAE